MRTLGTVVTLTTAAVLIQAGTTRAQTQITTADMASLDARSIEPAVTVGGVYKTTDGGRSWDKVLQVSRDEGRRWTEVSANVPDIRYGTYVGRIAASADAFGTAYAAFDGHRDGDFRPYPFRTDDFGMSWEPLHETLPAMGVANVIVEHPDNPNTFLVGTEHHAFVSTNRGATWARIPNLPATHYDDMLVHPREKDLVLGTDGQGIWIMNDTRALGEWDDSSGPVTVFSTSTEIIHLYRKDT